MGVRQQLEIIRTEARASGLSRAEIARRASVSKATLKGMFDPAWNPTARTIEGLELALFPEHRTNEVGDGTETESRG